MLTPHCSAASGMVAPLSIAATTRLRKSSEYGFAIHAGLLPVGSLNHIRANMGIPDSAFSGNALVVRTQQSVMMLRVALFAMLTLLVAPLVGEAQQPKKIPRLCFLS